MAFPVIGALIARAGAFVTSLGARAAGAVSSRAGGLIQGARNAAARGSASIQQRTAGLGQRISQTVQQGRQNIGQAVQQAFNGPGTGRRGRTRRRRGQATISQGFASAVRQGAKAARVSRKNPPFAKLFKKDGLLGRVARNYGSAQQNFRQGNNIQGVIDSIDVMKDIGKPLAKMNMAVLATVTTLVTMPKILKEFGSALIESKRTLGEVNAVYSVAAGRLDIRRFQRNIRLGNATSGSFRSLTESQNRLEEKLMPYAIMGTNALYKIVSLLQDTARHGVTAVEYLSYLSKYKPVMDAIAWWLSRNDARGDGQPLADLARAMARDNFQRRQRPPMPRDNGGAPPPARNPARPGPPGDQVA